jgi:hypothetical protein
MPIQIIFFDDKAGINQHFTTIKLKWWLQKGTRFNLYKAGLTNFFPDEEFSAFCVVSRPYRPILFRCSENLHGKSSACKR